MPANFKYYDSYGTERTVANVLEPVELTEVDVTSGNTFISVAEASVVYPGQAIMGPGIPLGSFVHSVQKSTGYPTKLNLIRSLFNRTTGLWTTSAANATTDVSVTGTTAMVFGFSPVAIVELAYAMGMWRNLHSARASGIYGTASNSLNTTVEAHSDVHGEGVAIVPTTIAMVPFGSGIYASASANVRTSDTLAATPLKRHNGELHGAYIIVSQYGYQSVVQALPGRELIYSPAA